MKKLLLCCMLLLLLAVLPLTGCTGGNAEGTPLVIMVTDAADSELPGFSMLSWKGLEKVTKKLDVRTQGLEVKNGEYEQAFEQAALEGDLVIGLGDGAASALNKVADAHPDVSFALVDSDDAKGDNIMCLHFENQEGAFLVGVAAGLNTQTGIIGFVGGMECETISEFEYGYRAGVAAVNPEAKVLTEYVGDFTSRLKAKQIVNKLWARNADVVFHAAGDAGRGVIESCAHNRIWAIGCDTDQAELAPETVLVSMVKRVDNAILYSAEQYVNDRFKAGTMDLDMSLDSMGYVDDEEHLTGAMRAVMKAYYRDILSGNLIPPTDEKGFKSFEKKLAAGQLKMPEGTETLETYREYMAEQALELAGEGTEEGAVNEMPDNGSAPNTGSDTNN